MTATDPKQLTDTLRKKDRISILFVCLGNICRSPAAQGIMQSMVDARGLSGRFRLDSCGFYGGHAGDLPDRRMRIHAARRDYRLDHRSRQIRPWDFDDFDLIIGMDDSNIYDLLEAAPSPEAQKKVARMTDFAARIPAIPPCPIPIMKVLQASSLCSTCLKTPAPACSTP